MTDRLKKGKVAYVRTNTVSVQLSNYSLIKRNENTESKRHSGIVIYDHKFQERIVEMKEKDTVRYGVYPYDVTYCTIVYARYSK